MRKLFIVLALAASACAPSINPQMKSATDSLVSSMRGGHHEGAPAAYSPMDWAEGQWLVMRTVNEKGQPSVMRMSIVGREGDGYWIEYETQDYFHRAISKMLFARQPRTADESMDLLQKMVTKTDDQEVQTMDYTDASNPGMIFAKSLMKSTVRGVAVTADIDSSTKEDVTVAAGHFGGCAKYATETTFGPFHDRSTSWFHPSVPLNGVVKAVSAENKWSYELLDYGYTGAKSAL